MFVISPLFSLFSHIWVVIKSTLVRTQSASGPQKSCCYFALMSKSIRNSFAGHSMSVQNWCVAWSGLV